MPAQSADGRGQFQVFELRADGLHALPLPPGITRIDDIFAVGDNAQETSFASANEPLW